MSESRKESRKATKWPHILTSSSSVPLSLESSSRSSSFPEAPRTPPSLTESFVHPALFINVKMKGFVSLGLHGPPRQGCCRRSMQRL